MHNSLTKRSDVRPSSLIARASITQPTPRRRSKECAILESYAPDSERRDKDPGDEGERDHRRARRQRMAIGLSEGQSARPGIPASAGPDAADRRRRKQHKQAYENNPSARPSFRIAPISVTAMS